MRRPICPLPGSQLVDALKAGFAETDITPGPGMAMPGGSRARVHNGAVHDPCKVRAAVFDDGTRRVGLVSVDAVMIPAGVVRDARNAIHRQCGIAPHAVMIAATHSHSAGPLGMHQPGSFDHAPKWLQELAYEKTICADAAYVEHVTKQIIHAVAMACADTTYSECGVAVGYEPGAVFNRRFHMRNGLTYTFPGQGNPDIVAPAGPIDPEVGVVGVWGQEGRLRGCIVNYACHLTAKPGGTSADWIFYLEQVIRAGLGDDAVVLFVNGACGDISPVDTLSPYTGQTGEKWARRVGGLVGAETLKALMKPVLGDCHPVAYRSQLLRLARRRPHPAKIEAARRLIERTTRQDESTEWFFARELLLLDALLTKEQEALVEAQAIQIGPAVFLSSPGELFCQLGKALKAATSFEFVFPVSLANGFCGYLPTPEAMGATGGGYETRLTSHSNLEVEAGVKIVSALAGLASELTPGELPVPPSPPSFIDSWSFGNVPAEL